PIIVMSMSSRFRSGFITLGHKLLLCSGRAAEDAESAGRLSRSRRYARRYHESSASDDLDTYQRRRRSSAMSATLPTNSELGGGGAGAGAVPAGAYASYAGGSRGGSIYGTYGGYSCGESTSRPAFANLVHRSSLSQAVN